MAGQAALDFLTPESRTGIPAVYIRGAKVRKNIKDAIISASVDMSVDSVTQLTMVLNDTGLALLKSGIFRKHTPIDYEDLRLEMTNLDTEPGAAGKGQITVKARSLIVGKLKRRTGNLVMKKVSPSQFVVAECKAVGAAYVVQPSPRRKAVKRDVQKAGEPMGNDIPSTWSTFQRLGQELGYMCFEVAGVVYFGKPTWFIKQPLAKLPVRWGSGPENEWADELPYCTYSTDDAEAPYTVKVLVPQSRARQFRPGRMVDLHGVPFFNGKYFITAVNYSLTRSGSVEVEAQTPVDPEPGGIGGGSGGTINLGGEIVPATGNRGTKLASDMVYWALKQSGDAYIFGAEAGLGERDPDAFDCSELVQWAVAQAGGSIPDGSTSQWAWCDNHGTDIPVSRGIATRGALLFKPGHVAISLGNGRTIEAVGRAYGVRTMSATDRSFNWTSAALVPGLRYV